MKTAPASRPRSPLLLALSVLAAAAWLGAPLPTSRAAAPAPLDAALRAVPNDEGAVRHALARLTFGPRPGDLERVRAQGLARFLDAQLHPERIDDGALAPRLKRLPTLHLDSATLMKRYDLPPDAKREIQRRRADLEDASEEQMRAARRAFVREYGDQMDGTPRQVLDELQAAKVVRAVHSERQLDELLVDFWMNHFNVYAQKGPLRFVIGEYEREVIRPRAWGRFEELLQAVAESPAMLFYLDNWLSSDPRAARELAERRRRVGQRRAMRGLGGRGRDADAADEQRRREALARHGGLNENYARELLELHTLGVDGGYTQKDVTEVARVFTGWTLRRPRQQAEFHFEARLHDRGDKVVLGHRIAGAGREEGRQVLHLLATHPSTARFIAAKLARRFVADDPPAALVERAAATFTRTGGDIRAVLTTLVTAPEFFAPAARAAKVKTPLDFVVSAVRAAGVQVDDGRDLARRIAEMGMPLYLQAPPTGYDDGADAWVSTAGMLARFNFALDLSAGRVRGLAGPSAQLDSRQLGSPEFQRR